MTDREMGVRDTWIVEEIEIESGRERERERDGWEWEGGLNDGVREGQTWTL